VSACANEKNVGPFLPPGIGGQDRVGSCKSRLMVLRLQFLAGLSEVTQRGRLALGDAVRAGAADGQHQRRGGNHRPCMTP